MDWSQYLYIGLLALACYTGRPKPIVVLLMCTDLAATMLLAGDPVSVAVADLCVAALLIGEGWRANVIAAIFILMQPVYVVGDYLGLQNGAIYALIDLLAYVQLGVLGGWDAGIRRASRHLRGRHHSHHRPANTWGHAIDNLARSETQNRR